MQPQSVDWLTIINTAVGLMSIFLGGFAIWIALHLYTKAKDTEKETAKALEAIKAQSDALQRLTGRWMDRFTRHATEPRPADEGLMQLVHVVASLPMTILEVVRSPGQSGASPQLIREIVDGSVGLYYYSALANVLAQSLLPPEEVFGLFGNCRENETGFNTPPNVFNDLAGQARGFCSRFHGNSQRASLRPPRSISLGC